MSADAAAFWCSNRMKIHAKMKKITRGTNLRCNNYFRCIKNFQFLIDNYVQHDAPYCINLSSHKRRKILDGLEWMKTYLIKNRHEEKEELCKSISDMGRSFSFGKARSLSSRVKSIANTISRASSNSHSSHPQRGDIEMSGT